MTMTAEQLAQTIRPDLEMLCSSEELTSERREALARIVEHLTPPNLLALLDELERVTAERNALREGEMGDARHSNTRAAADIYFQLIEECQIPAGGSLVEHIDTMRDRIAELEARTVTVKLPEVERPIDGTGYANAAGAQYYKERVINALAAVGVTVEG